jgi:hypothetical protein
LEAHFPPGATTCKHKPRIHSRWREFRFAFERILDAITPHVPIAAVIACWNQVAADLGERDRRRKPQVLAREVTT